MNTKKTPFSVLLGVNIRNARRDVSITQNDLAKELNITRMTMVSIEKGRSTPSVYEMVRISEFLGVPMKDLLPKQSS